jgi:error-prone DNA polymerase
VILSASMLGVDGEIQREGAVVHVVARRLHDLSELLASVGQRDMVLPHGRGDEALLGLSITAAPMIRAAR